MTKTRLPSIPRATRSRRKVGRPFAETGESATNYIQTVKGGGYWVSGPLRTESVGPAATAKDAIAMVITRLPANAGPAFVGTPEQLAAHETLPGSHPATNPDAQ
ncbi:DUF6193 family natural product biosynthesis protein [Streptomyces sp. NBC_00059]|uniref:DUF6193 family natural product biosynthesis protein n=1 Tax=Streptomyces sp. NBC_00059 TaxID=2975635 RepID=UPI0022548C22|nr:DUF6193 family natural product biosynthesis protein [Streptomyces sp. NBC_00059]MCX5416331.1 DUF6193 family natural product biosynthesis protein [Streptomyces sp. NBC_00059]